MMRKPLLAMLMAGALAAPSITPAFAQMDSREGIALQNQILELRRDLQSVQSQRGGSLPAPVVRGGGGGGGGGRGGELSTLLLDRVSTLEEEVRRMRGQLDELANASRRQQEELAKQIADMNFRLQNAGTAAPARQPAAAAAPAEAPSSARRPPELAMQEGNAALARRDYAVSESAAREVLAGGRGPRGTDAQFLLAQSLTGKRDYQGAAIAYDDAYNRSRTGSRAPEALLGIANAMLQLNERGAACASLDKLRSEFSTPRAEIRDGAAQLRTRAACR